MLYACNAGQGNTCLTLANAYNKHELKAPTATRAAELIKKGCDLKDEISCRVLKTGK